MSIFIIAEIGINHNGDLDVAKKLIKGAKDAGADAVLQPSARRSCPDEIPSLRVPCSPMIGAVTI